MPNRGMGMTGNRLVNGAIGIFLMSLGVAAMLFGFVLQFASNLFLELLIGGGALVAIVFGFIMLLGSFM